MIKRTVIIYLIIALFLVSLRSFCQVGKITGWGMSVCNTFSFNICPNQTITPFNYGSQGWACNFNVVAPDISFNILGPVWRVARNNYTFAANVNGQFNGFDAAGTPLLMPYTAGQTITPASYSVIGGVNCVNFALNGSPTAFTFNQTNFSISINPAVFGGNNYTLCVNTATSITISPNVPPLGGPWNYNWLPGNLPGNPVVVSPSVNTIYTVIATAAGSSCTNIATIPVTVTNCCTPPVVSASASPTVMCSGQSTTLYASGAGAGATYTWSPGNIVGASVVVTPTVNTVFTVSGTSTTNCTGTATMQIIINQLPIVTPGSNTLCTGSTVSLTVGAGNTYSWSGPAGFTSNIQNPIIANAQPSNAGIYSIAVTNTNGCTNSNTVNVVVNSIPVITPVNTGPYCQGATISLSVTAGASYSWSGPGGYSGNIQSPFLANAQPSNAGIYNVTVTSVAGCQGVGSTSIIINSSPLAIANNNGPVCVGQPVNFTGLGGVTYTWTGAGGFNSMLQNPVIPIVQFINAGVYTLSVSDNLGCIGIATVNLGVNSLPAIIVNNPLLCIGQNINLTANGGASYLWQGPLGYNSIQQNPVIGNAQLNMSGAYTVIVTNTAGCIAASAANVTVIAVNSPTITSNAPICEGSALNLNGFGNGTYNWYGPNGFNSALQNCTLLNVQPIASGDYTLVNIVGSCSVSATLNVIINQLPFLYIANNSPLCNGSVLNLNAAGANTYQWTGPNSYTAIGTPLIIQNVSNVNAGTYTVNGVSAAGCTKNFTTDVIINSSPAVSAIGSTLCMYQTMTLSANGGTAYSWTGPAGYASGLQTPLTANAVPSMAGNYSVSVTGTNGCLGSAEANVVINSIPGVTVSTDEVLCSGGTIHLNVQSTANFYTWNGPNGFSSVVKNPELKNIDGNYAGIYTVTVTDNIGCQQKATVAIVINQLPDVVIESSKTKGCVPLCVNFASQSNITLINSSWNFADGSGSSDASVPKCFDRPGNYLVAAGFTDINGCTNTATVIVEAYPIPIADFNYTSSKPIENEPVKFTDASYGANITWWSWNFSNFKNKSFITSDITLSFENAGDYAVALVVTSDHGCMDTVVKAITIEEDFGIYIPNAFTPDKDGINDVFQPKGYGIVKYEMDIFDKWGERLFSTSDFTYGWDGSYKTQEIVQQDVYVWKIVLSGISGKRKEYSGQVTLIR